MNYQKFARSPLRLIAGRTLHNIQRTAYRLWKKRDKRHHPGYQNHEEQGEPQ